MCFKIELLYSRYILSEKTKKRKIYIIFLYAEKIAQKPVQISLPSGYTQFEQKMYERERAKTSLADEISSSYTLIQCAYFLLKITISFYTKKCYNTVRENIPVDLSVYGKGRLS